VQHVAAVVLSVVSSVATVAIVLYTS